MIAIMSPPWLSRLDDLVQCERTLQDGQTLFRASGPVRHHYLVRSGCVLLTRVQQAGDALVLQRARAGDLVAEASVFAPRYHCDAVCSGLTRVGQILRSDIESLQRDEPEWVRAFAVHLAGEVQRVRARAQLLSLKRVDERLDAWLALNAGGIPPRGTWVDLAAELAVTPEALYRALARRRAEPLPGKLQRSAA
jgi:CRP/FNR family transcriptional regulator, dissimilatory nitrate respiration regulator